MKSRLKKKFNNKAPNKLLIFALLLLGLIVLGGAITWDSSTDPLVSKSWVDSYINQKLNPLEARLEKVQGRLNLSTVLEMKINQSYALINGVKTPLAAPPIIHNSRTMLPLRFLGESLEAEIVWDNTAKKVTYKKGTTTLELTVNQKTMKVNGVVQQLDTPPVLVNNSTLVPVRVISDGLGAKVDWDNATKKVTISY